ncbi:MAG: hypothetical protein CMJ42_05445 [Phyllobacteriaceae bacterium]|nr:hypothetical protein [Phyllobacteriaceae bacterium]MBA91224.1 hypothetical protein [Phyllobacteriaceae bacterium]
MARQRAGLHERNGRWHARKIIPAELRTYFDNKWELSRPLGSDKREANRQLPIVMAEFESRIAAARRKHEGDRLERVTGARARYPLTIEQMALAHYLSELDHDTRERTFPDQSKIADISWSRPAFKQVLIRAASGRISNEEMDAVVGWAINTFAARGNHSFERFGTEWRSLGMAIATAQLEALAREDERNSGDFTGEPVHSMLKDTTGLDLSLEPVSLTGLLDDFLKEREAGGRGREARRKWTPTIKDFVAFIGHDDARRVTKADILKWKDAKLGSGLAPTTFKRGHFAALNAVLRWAHENDRIESNAADGVRLRAQTPIQNREKGFRDDEAMKLLMAASSYLPLKQEDAKLAAAKRWIPWLCAFTGARLGEIVQLRRQDIHTVDGLHVLRITPEAGTVKTGKFRDVPIHQQIVDDGFFDYVASVAIGPLFLTTNASRTVEQASRTVQNQLRNWIKDLNVVPDGISPFHGWRHRFKTVGRELGIDSIVLDAIQGHARRTAGDNYGDITLKAKKAAIDKFPRLQKS